MTSHLDNYGTSDIKREILSGVQTKDEIQLDEYDVYMVLRKCKKDNIFVQRQCLQSFT